MTGTLRDLRKYEDSLPTRQGIKSLRLDKAVEKLDFQDQHSVRKRTILQKDLQKHTTPPEPIHLIDSHYVRLSSRHRGHRA